MGENRQIYSRLKKLLNKNFIKIKKKRRSLHEQLTHSRGRNFLPSSKRIFIGARVGAHIFRKKKRKKERTDGLFTMADRWSKSARDDSRYRFEGNDAARSRIPVQLTRPAALSKRKYRRPLKIYHRGPFFPPSRL